MFRGAFAIPSSLLPQNALGSPTTPSPFYPQAPMQATHQHFSGPYNPHFGLSALGTAAPFAPQPWQGTSGLAELPCCPVPSTRPLAVPECTLGLPFKPLPGPVMPSTLPPLAAFGELGGRPSPLDVQMLPNHPAPQQGLLSPQVPKALNDTPLPLTRQTHWSDAHYAPQIPGDAIPSPSKLSIALPYVEVPAHLSRVAGCSAVFAPRWEHDASGGVLPPPAFVLTTELQNADVSLTM